MPSTARQSLTVSTVFRGATRKGSSTNGNPTWILHTDAGDYRTQTDASIGYSVSNYTGGPGSMIGKAVDLTLTRAGRVTDLTAA